MISCVKSNSPCDVVQNSVSAFCHEERQYRMSESFCGILIEVATMSIDVCQFVSH